MNSFSPPIVISSGFTNVRCLVKQLFSSEHIPQIAVNILIDSTLGRRLRIFLKPSLRWLPISAATTTIFPAIANWSHISTMSSKNCPSSMPETISEQFSR